MSASGSSTPRYKVVQGHYYLLVLNFEQSLPSTAAHLFQARLIDSTTLAEAGNGSQPAFERSSALLGKILKKIEIDQKWYDVFLHTLHEVNDLTDIANDLDGALKKEEESTNVRPVSPRRIPPPPQYVLPQRIPPQPVPPWAPERRSRSYSDSDVQRSEPRPKTTATHLERDSGVTTSTFGDGDEILPEEAESEIFDSEQPEASIQNNSELQVSLFLSQRAASSLVCATSSANHMPMMCGSPPHEDLNLEVQIPIERASSDQVPPPTSTTFSNSDNWNRKATNIYLQSVNEEQACEITKLNETISNLSKEREVSTLKLKEQGEVIDEKESLIVELINKCKMKDQCVEDLSKNKAEMEKEIEDLEKRCLEADKKQAENQEEIESLHISHKKKIDELQKNLEKVESRERLAQIDLANAKTKLSDAKLDKEKEISKLKEEFHKQERIKFELQLSKRNLEEERKRECLVKDKEMALKDKELALKDKELAMKDKELISKDKELAEEKQKRAQDGENHAKEVARRAQDGESRAKEEAKRAQDGESRAKEEAKRAQDGESKAKEEARQENEKMSLRVQELEKELRSMKLQKNK